MFCLLFLSCKDNLINKKLEISTFGGDDNQSLFIYLCSLGDTYDILKYLFDYSKYFQTKIDTLSVDKFNRNAIYHAITAIQGFDSRNESIDATYYINGEKNLFDFLVNTVYKGDKNVIDKLINMKTLDGTNCILFQVTKNRSKSSNATEWTVVKRF